MCRTCNSANSGGWPSRLVRLVFAAPIWLYQQVVSPWLPASCIYSPSCSWYARVAIERHGIFKGTVLMVSRVLRCSAFFDGGEDPVPERFSWSGIRHDYRRFRRSGGAR